MTLENMTETTTPASGDCGSGACGCTSAVPLSAYERTAAAMPVQVAESLEAVATNVPPAINGIALTAPGEKLEVHDLKERAYGELLRQEAVRLGLLPAAVIGQEALSAPALRAQEQEVIDRMLETEVTCPQPTPEESQRYYDAHKAQFTVGQSQRVRHILFAVTPGVNVQALAQRAETALLELASNAALPERFSQLAAELSNCPTGAQGGDLGWASPGMFVPEFEEIMNKLQTGQIGDPMISRFGVHLIQVLERRDAPISERELREVARNNLREKKFEETYQLWAQEIRGHAYIEYRELPQ